MKINDNTIESLIQERRKTEKESKMLQAQIDRLEAEKLEKDDAGTLEALSSQIEELSFEKKEKAKKLKDICRIARTVSAGDWSPGKNAYEMNRIKKPVPWMHGTGFLSMRAMGAL